MRNRGPYSHLPEARQFDRQHVLIHHEANRLMDMHQAGQVEQAVAGFGSVQLIADEMVVLLQTMEEKLRREA
ncbi:hypothetical protein JAO73_13845 [Hymenobacter sp. BT523]|uniref:hypothetical protein n=1 Tax=Hymenobacter sp. BT523 TaxID=2795725 RepID=UPI0018ECB4E9|nr:hypothetical protein [Hymenobacter sp. BT523]MBJ6110101.1 hypothetical protein [Hymenobacter sp. BT523]